MGIENMTRNALGAVASAWRKDKEFRARVEADPKAALAEKGVDVPAEDVRVAVDKEDNLHVVVPTDPNGEMSDEELKMVSGGAPRWLERARRHRSQIDEYVAFAQTHSSESS